MEVDDGYTEKMTSSWNRVFPTLLDTKKKGTGMNVLKGNPPAPTKQTKKGKASDNMKTTVLKK